MIKAMNIPCDLTEGSFISAIMSLSGGAFNPDKTIKLICHWSQPTYYFMRLAGATVQVKPHSLENTDYWELHYGDDIIYSDGA